MASGQRLGDGWLFFLIPLYGAYLMILFHVLLFYDCKYTS